MGIYSCFIYINYPYNTLQALSNKYLNPNHKDDSYFFLTKVYKLQEPLFQELAKINLMKEELNYKVPVIFISGENDWVTPVSLTEDYFNVINSPYKDILYVSDAGHNCFQEKPEDFFKLLSKALCNVVKQKGMNIIQSPL